MNYKEYAKNPIFFEKNRVFRVYLGGKLFSDNHAERVLPGFVHDSKIQMFQSFLVITVKTAFILRSGFALQQKL